MTREEEIWYERRRELLQMIREAGISTGGHPMNPLQAYPEQFERFAALVYELVIKHEREKEREECAKMFDGEVAALRAELTKERAESAWAWERLAAKDKKRDEKRRKG